MPFQIEFPDGVDLRAGMLTITLEDTGRTIQHNVTVQTAKLQEQLDAANLQIQQLQGQLADALKLEPLPAPPVVDPPPLPEPPKPVPAPAPVEPPVKPVAFNIEGEVLVCIVKDDTPSTKQNATTREVLDIAAEMGATGWTGFFNESEVQAHLKNINHTTLNLVKYGADRRLKTFGADTINAMLRVIPAAEDEARLQPYLGGLIKLGADFIIWNDVDGVDDDGERVYPPDAIKAGMKRLRDALKAIGFPNFPIMASLTAAAKPDFYRTEYGFDLVEMQTFGNLKELQGFMDDLFDVYALDAQKSFSVAEIRAARPFIVKGASHALRLYAGFDYDDNDFREMPDQVKEHTITIQQWKEARAA